MVWSSDLTRGEENDLKRIQKVTIRIFFAEDDSNYDCALKAAFLQTLKARRTQLRLRFAIKCTETERANDMFPEKIQNGVNIRCPEKYEVNMASTGRLSKSDIPETIEQAG